MRDIGHHDAAFAQAVGHGMPGQLPDRERDRTLAVFDPREAFFFRRSDDHPIPDQAGRAVVKRSVDTQREHGLLQVARQAPT
jgi:hypothetical protein